MVWHRSCPATLHLCYNHYTYKFSFYYCRRWRGISCTWKYENELSDDHPYCKKCGKLWILYKDIDVGPWLGFDHVGFENSLWLYLTIDSNLNFTPPTKYCYCLWCLFPEPCVLPFHSRKKKCFLLKVRGTKLAFWIECRVPSLMFRWWCKATPRPVRGKWGYARETDGNPIGRSQDTLGSWPSEPETLKNNQNKEPWGKKALVTKRKALIHAADQKNITLDVKGESLKTLYDDASTLNFTTFIYICGMALSMGIGSAYFESEHLSLNLSQIEWVMVPFHSWIGAPVLLLTLQNATKKRRRGDFCLSYFCMSIRFSVKDNWEWMGNGQYLLLP